MAAFKQFEGKPYMPPKKVGRKEFVKYHNGGTVRAKGRVVNGVPSGYREWFRKDGSKMRSGYFESGAQRGSGSRMTGGERPQGNDDREEARLRGIIDGTGTFICRSVE